MYTVLGMFLA